MNWLVVSSHAGFLECLAKSRVSMAGLCHVLGAGAILHGEHALAEHFSGVRTDNVHSEDLALVGVNEDLHEAVGVKVRARPAVRHERENALSVFYARCLQVLLSLTH